MVFTFCTRSRYKRLIKLLVFNWLTYTDSPNLHVFEAFRERLIRAHLLNVRRSNEPESADIPPTTPPITAVTTNTHIQLLGNGNN